MPKVFSDEQENKIKKFINLALDYNKTHNIFSGDEQAAQRWRGGTVLASAEE